MTEYGTSRADVKGWPRDPETRAALEQYLDELSTSTGRIRPMFSGELYDFAGADLSGLDLQDAYLFNSILTGVRMVGCNLGKANLIGARLEGADLSDANMYKAEAKQCLAIDAVFRRAHLVGVDLFRADLTRADLREAIMNSSDLDDADVREADLRGAYLRLAGFGPGDAPTKLDGARVAGVTLDGANGYLSGAVDIGDTEPHLIDGDELVAWLKTRGAGDVSVLPT